MHSFQFAVLKHEFHRYLDTLLLAELVWFRLTWARTIFLPSARPCASPVGLQSKAVRNTAITASSWKNKFNGPYLARLHLTRNGRYMGAWMTTIRNSNQWLQVALGRPMTITGIATQGNPDTNQWVRQYVVAFSQDKMHFEYYMQFGNLKVCSGFGANSVYG